MSHDPAAALGPADRLERCGWDTFWVPPRARVLDRPELLVLGADRPEPHVNVCQRLRAPDARVPALVDEALAHMHAGCRRFFVPDTFDAAPLERALGARGLAPGVECDARVARPDLVVEAPPLRVALVADADALARHARVMQRAFDLPEQPEDDPAREVAMCTGPDARVRRHLATIDGEAVAAAGMSWFPALGVAFLWGGATLPEARGRGCYRALVAARLEAARALGATWVGLYARADTSSPIVARLGFDRVGRAAYWRPVDATDC